MLTDNNANSENLAIWLNVLKQLLGGGNVICSMFLYCNNFVYKVSSGLKMIFVNLSVLYASCCKYKLFEFGKNSFSAKTQTSKFKKFFFARSCLVKK
jgi:hypothetical protein